MIESKPVKIGANMKAIEMLKNEHRLIEKVLAALEYYIGAIDKGEEIDRRDLAKFTAFIRTFADSCHHGKEEGILFAEMIERGFSREQGPVAVMLMEHNEGRRLISRLNALADKKEPWAENDRQEISRTATEYIDLLRRHIMKEDNILYPAAEQNIPPEIMTAMYDRFERFEEEETGVGEHEKFHRMAEELVRRYSPGASPANHHH
ncbi:Hemerythrin HHE cation binding domain protein [Candidatus Zixiibacteriota bacterium]|nr:Hemerythrin HHE cation binding domain protein [candidate division Zixibacteria bacterium]